MSYRVLRIPPRMLRHLDPGWNSLRALPRGTIGIIIVIRFSYYDYTMGGSVCQSLYRPKWWGQGGNIFLDRVREFCYNVVGASYCTVRGWVGTCVAIHLTKTRVRKFSPPKTVDYAVSLTCLALRN